MTKGYRVPIYRVELVRESGLWASEKEVTTPMIAAEIARAYLDGADREKVIALLLDNRNKVLGIHLVAVGTLSGAMVHPRETFKAAILANANSLILVHNHPSGDPRPSPDDAELFSRMKEAGHVVGIRIHDCLIIGFEEHYSWTSGCNFTLSE